MQWQRRHDSSGKHRARGWASRIGAARLRHGRVRNEATFAVRSLGYFGRVSSTLDAPVRYDQADGKGAQRKRHALYLMFNTVLCVVVLAAVIEAATGAPVYGVDTGTVSVSNESAKLKVEYPKVTRGQLVSSLRITVDRAGGFAGPVVLAISADYLGPFLTQGPTPQTSSETADDSDVIMTFDPPPGDTFVVDWNLTPEPIGKFATVSARVALLDDNQHALASVNFDTKLRP
jgi:hypothetical protein